MEDQNKSKGGIIDIPKNLFNKAVDPGEEVKKMTDASGQDNGESVVIHPGGFENVQTQSMVKSNRENVDEELARIKAYNDEILRQQKIQLGKEKVKKVMARVLIILLSISFVAVAAWLIVNIISISQPTVVAPGGNSGNEGGGGQENGKIGGYDCKSSSCRKVTDLPDGSILIYDNSFYSYNAETKKITLLTIEDQTYHEIKPFQWGDNQTLLILDLESGQSGLFSLTENRTLSSYSYDAFYTNPSDKKYSQMEWAIGSYIIARTNGTDRLLKLSDGSEVVRGKEGVFIKDNFCFGYEAENERRIYTLGGKQIAVAQGGSRLYVKNNNIVVVSGEVGRQRVDIYDSDGNVARAGVVYDEVRTIRNDISGTLDSNNSYFKIPASR